MIARKIAIAPLEKLLPRAIAIAKVTQLVRASLSE